MSIGRLFARLAGLRRDRRGAALIEFAFTAPVLLLLFVGGYQLMDAIAAYRKVTTTVRALADLTTQSPTITSSGAQQFLAASQQIMAPYATTNAVLRISQIKINALGVATIDWSQALNGTGYTQGSVVALPANVTTPNSYLIYSEINYQYVPGIASNLIGQIPLRDTIYMAPRASASVTCTGC